MTSSLIADHKIGSGAVLMRFMGIARESFPYRGAGGRDHSDIPPPELAGLAEMLRTSGLEEDEDIIRGMQEHFALGRLKASTRERFEAAAATAG
jgi:hypothetical protein